MAEYKILQEKGVDIYPVTHPDAVRDENGKTIIEKVNEMKTPPITIEWEDGTTTSGSLFKAE